MTLVPNATAISQDKLRYEIAIGSHDNKRAFVWKFRQSPGTYNFSPFAFGQFLSKTEYRPFWLSWANHTITFGRGHQIGFDVLTFKDTSSYPTETNYLFVRSYGTNTAHFKYGYYDGNFVCDFSTTTQQFFNVISSGRFSRLGSVWIVKILYFATE